MLCWNGFERLTSRAIAGPPRRARGQHVTINDEYDDLYGDMTDLSDANKLRVVSVCFDLEGASTF
jgi:hypothetical protein